jgi:uncharacterized protein DUF4198
MRRLFPTLAAALALLALASAAAAHDLFLRLESYFAPPRTTVLIRVLNGTFVKSEGSVQRNRLREITLAAGGRRQTLDTSAWTDTSKTTSTLSFRTAEPGTYVIGASVKPRLIQLSAKEFNEYLEHDGVPDVLSARRRAGELRKPARERYHKHVKAIVQVGSVRTGDYDATFGYPAELVPTSNPYIVRVGQVLAFRCLLDGAPVPKQYVVAGYDTGSGRITEHGYRADSSGIVRVPITRRGKWYVKFIHMEPVQDSVNYESKWASLTFEIR